MQALPSIEVLGFLNWMTLEGYPSLCTDIPIDELFLDSYEHRHLIMPLAESYLRNRQYYDRQSEGDTAIILLDTYLSLFRAKAMEHIHSDYFDTADPHEMEHLFHRSFHDAMEPFEETARQFYDRGRYSRRNRLFHPARLYGDSSIRPSDLIDSVRFYFTHSSDGAVSTLIASNPGSIAHATVSFIRYVKEHTKLQNANIRNIPSNIMQSMIDHYVWHTFSRRFTAETQTDKNRALLSSIFIEHKYDDYLGNILPHTEFSSVAQRMFRRHVRFKCTLLSDGKHLRDFVDRNWQELNDYSADHLDIFYNDRELLLRGYVTADKLNIRSRVSTYPSLYLWEYQLDSGLAIPIDGLEEDRELLDIFKAIVDLAQSGKNLQAVAEAAAGFADQCRQNKMQRKSDEQDLTDLILNACRELQNQRIWHQTEGRSENSRNTFISSLLSQSRFVSKDQSLGGESSTGISIGENDIKIFRNQNEPFAIIEALNLSAPYGKDWHHKNFREHVNRIYKYDTNGLSQNYLLTYVDTPMFDKYWSSVLHEFTVTNKCKFGHAEFIDISDLPDQSNADLRIGVARYRRNGRIVKLYVIAVLMSDHADIPNPASNQ